MTAIRVLIDTNDGSEFVVLPGTTTDEVRAWLTGQFTAPGVDLADDDQETVDYLIDLAVDVATSTSTPLDGDAVEAVASGLQLRIGLKPEADELLAGPLRLAWDGPGVEAATEDGSWSVALEVPNPDEDGEWLPVSSLCDGAGWRAAGDLCCEFFTGADGDPTEAEPYAGAEDRLLARWGISRDQLTEISGPW